MKNRCPHGYSNINDCLKCEHPPVSKVSQQTPLVLQLIQTLKEAKMVIECLSIDSDTPFVRKIDAVIKKAEGD
jgi:hypothetical protein